MTPDLIANMLGARREGVTEAAGKLQKPGVITSLSLPVAEPWTVPTVPLRLRGSDLLVGNAMRAMHAFPRIV
jgi:hypothetical protein